MNPFQFANTKPWTEDDPQLIFACPLHQDAEPIMKLLVLHGFHPTVTVAAPPFNPNYAFSKLPDHVRLWVLHEEYDDAHQVLVDHQVFAPVNEEEALLQMLEPCTDEELHQILATEDRFPTNQVAAAKQLILKRGTTLDPLLIDRIFHARNAALRKLGSVNVAGLFIWLLMIPLNPAISFIVAILVLFYQGTDLEGRSYPLYNTFAKLCAFAIITFSALLILMLSLLLSGALSDFPDLLLMSLAWLH